MAMDVDYIQAWSLFLDWKLLARTIPAVLSGRGAY
jgi:lipopolysaccharide/colanic/teichoic acid biosynthesis glycosyltransferase